MAKRFSCRKRRYRAILTRAASKFPPKIVLPFGVAAPAAGSAETPAGRSRAPAMTASVPLAPDSLAAPAVKLFIEQQIAVRTELDNQGRDVSPVCFDGLNGARKVNRPVGRDRHPAARVYDFTGCIRPLPDQVAAGRYF